METFKASEFPEDLCFSLISQIFNFCVLIPMRFQIFSSLVMKGMFCYLSGYLEKFYSYYYWSSLNSIVVAENILPGAHCIMIAPLPLLSPGISLTWEYSFSTWPLHPSQGVIQVPSLPDSVLCASHLLRNPNHSPLLCNMRFIRGTLSILYIIYIFKLCIASICHTV